jgi:hypothetical protein
MSPFQRLLCLASLVSLTTAGAPTAWAGASGCDTTCPPGSTQQLDECGPAAGSTFDPNGGCNQIPPAFQFVPIDLPICGTVGGYLESDGTPARDMDWFVFSIKTPSIISVTAHQRSGISGEPSPKFVLALFDSPNCGSQNILSYVVGGECPLKTEQVIVQPGEYVFMVTVDAFGTSDPLSACPVDYVARIGVDELFPACTGSTNGCLNNYATPGCSDPACCSLICGNPSFAYCCSIAWDAYCAAEAAMSEQCAGDGCPRARGKASVAKYMISRSRAKMTQTDPDLLEVHQQLSLAIALTNAAKNQLPTPGQPLGNCAGINLTSLGGKFDKATTLIDFGRSKVEFLITNPQLPADEVTLIVAVIQSTLASAEGVIDLALQQLSPCPADLFADGTVDAADLGVLLGNWGIAGLGDFDENGTVDGADLAVLLGAWGSCPTE